MFLQLLGPGSAPPLRVLSFLRTLRTRMRGTILGTPSAAHGSSCCAPVTISDVNCDQITNVPHRLNGVWDFLIAPEKLRCCSQASSLGFSHNRLHSLRILARTALILSAFFYFAFVCFLGSCPPFSKVLCQDLGPFAPFRHSQSLPHHSYQSWRSSLPSCAKLSPFASSLAFRWSK